MGPSQKGLDDGVGPSTPRIGAGSEAGPQPSRIGGVAKSSKSIKGDLGTTSRSKPGMSFAQDVEDLTDEEGDETYVTFSSLRYVIVIIFDTYTVIVNDFYSLLY